MKVIWKSTAISLGLAITGMAVMAILYCMGFGRPTLEATTTAVAAEVPAAMMMDFPRPSESVPIQYAAVLEPKLRTLLSTEINSKVVKVYKKMGDSFKSGDLLIQLDDIVQKAMLERAVAALEKAKISLQAKTTLLHDGIASFSDYTDARAALAVAESDVVIAGQNLAHTKVVAPYDGRVVAVNVADDEYPNREFHYKDKPLIEIVNDQVMLAKVLVPASLLSKIKHGQTILIHVGETGQIVEGSVTRIGAMIDPISSTIPIEAEIDNSSGALIGGMTGIADLEVGEQP